MDSLRKRRQLSVDSSGSYVPKRFKPTTQPRQLSIDNLPYNQKYIVAQAATILEVPVPNLRSAINELEDSSETCFEFHGWQQSPRVNMRSPFNKTKASPKRGFVSSSGEKSTTEDDWGFDDDEFSDQQWNGTGPDSYLGLSNLSLNTLPRDSTFGFLKGPIFGDCLANFCLPDSTSYGNGYETENIPLPMPPFEAKPTDNPPEYTDLITNLPYSQEVNYNALQMEELGFDMPPFDCDAPEFSDLWMIPPLQPIQVHTQPHRQEMVYTQPPPDGYSGMGQPYMVGRVDEYPQPTFTGSGFQDSDTGHSYQKFETEPESDSGQSVRAANAAENLLVPIRRGPFKNSHDRVQTAQTRKDGSCVRCRAQKIRCNPDPDDPKGVCLTCKSVKVVNNKIQAPLCARYKITDVRLFKLGQVSGLEWSQRWSNRTLKDLTTWASNEPIILRVSEGYTSNPLELVVREFRPLKGDVLHRSWVTPGGDKRSVLVPPYAIMDLSAAKGAYEKYINNHGAEFFKGALDPKDKFLWRTYSMAISTSNDPDTPEVEKRLLKMVLRLWVAIRLNTRATNIVGSETLGMPQDVLDETHPNHRSIPIPPVMGNQIELILSREIQDPLRTKVLDALQKLILSNKTSCWFTIYLSIFILLHNCAMITRHDAAYARKHGIEARFARPTMVAEYHTGANNVLAHFHYCNKGSYPFSLEGEKSDVLAQAGLNENQMRFIQATRKYVNSEAKYFDSLRWQGAFENDYYFIAQLYDQNWKPRTTI